MSDHTKSGVKLNKSKSYIGAGNANAKSFWDKPMRISEVAAILRIRTSVLKEAVLSGKQDIDGKPLPEIDAITSVDIVSKGRSVEKVLSDWANAPRSKKVVI